MPQQIQPTPISLFSPISNRNAEITKDSRLYNGFAEKSQEGEDVWVYKRPGLLQYNLPAGGVGAGEGQGVFNWNNDIYAIVAGNLYKNGTLVGSITPTTGMFHFTSQMGATPKLFLQSTTTAWNYDDTDGLVQVTDANYPATTVPGCVYLDGFTYVMDPTAHIQGDNFNDQTTWDALNVLIAQIEPEMAVRLAKQLVYVVALKQTYTEVFYDAGNPTGSPLGPVQGSKLNVGCRAAGSVKDVGGDLAWVGTTRLGAVKVMIMSQVKGESISTPPVNRLLSGLDYTTTWSWSMEVGGHVYYVVTVVNANLTLAFDLTSKLWYIWTDTNGNYMPIVSSTYDGHANPVLQHATDGKLYTMSLDQFTDEGTPFPWDLYTPNWDGGLRIAKTVASAELIADQINTNVNVSWSDDDYQTFTTPQAVNLLQDRPMYQDGSTFRRRAWHLNNLDSTFLRIKAIHPTMSPGSF